MTPTQPTSTRNVILIAGKAGSGKDTIANMLEKQLSAKGFDVRNIWFAAPIKDFAANVFDFSRDQLWGSSHYRNVPDLRFRTPTVQHEVLLRLKAYGRSWIESLYGVLPEPPLPAAPSGDLSFFEYLKTARPYLSPVEKSQRVLNAYSALEALVANQLLDPQLTARRVLQELGTEWGRQVIATDIWIQYAKHMVTRPPVETDDRPKVFLIRDTRFQNEAEAFRQAVNQGEIDRMGLLHIEREGSGLHGETAQHASEDHQWLSHWCLHHVYQFTNNSKGLESLEHKVQEMVPSILHRLHLVQP